MYSNKVVITDSTCFIILNKINALFILRDVFDDVITTSTVVAECRFDLPDWVHIQDPKDISLQQQFSGFVDEGEASAIALALEIKFDYLIVDDLKARKFATQLGIQIKGTIALIRDAKELNIIPAIKPYLNAIKRTDFRLSDALIQQFLKDAGEL